MQNRETLLKKDIVLKKLMMLLAHASYTTFVIKIKSLGAKNIKRCFALIMRLHKKKLNEDESNISLNYFVYLPKT